MNKLLRLAVLIGAVVSLGAALAWMPRRAPRALDPAEVARAVAAVSPLGPDVFRGACLAHTYHDGGDRGYGSEASAQSKAELLALGVDWVSVTPFAWQRALTSSEVEFQPNMSGGESDARVKAEIAQAHAMGMKAMLKPHLWVGRGEWRGAIDPEGGWDRWFDSYGRFMLHQARLAADAQADALVIGVELGSSVREAPARWERLITEVRAVYSGPLTYAANWDEPDAVPFWQALDWIGIQMFAPLSAQMPPTRDGLLKGARQHLSAYEGLSQRVGRPLVFTEVGYRAGPDAAVEPSAWPERIEAPVVDDGAQALAYAAFFEAAARSPSVRGVFFWKWFTDTQSGEEGRHGFNPRGKPAAQVISLAFARPAPVSAPAPAD